MRVLLVLAILLPYIGVGGVRFPADVQPWAALLAVAILGGTWLRSGQLRLTRTEFLTIVLAGCLAAYVDGDLHDVERYATKSAAFLVSMAIYLAARHLHRRHLVHGVAVATALYAVHAAMQILDRPLFEWWASNFVPVRDVLIGERGVASLTPEATDLGLTMVYIALLAWALLSTAVDRREVRLLRWVLGVAVAVLLLSRSGSGIGGGLLVLAAGQLPALRARGRARARRGVPPRKVAALAVVVLVFVGGLPAHVRGFRLVHQTATAPSALVDTSFVYRYVHNEVAVRAVFDSNGLGFGAGSFSREAPRIYADAGIGDRLDLTPHYAERVPESLTGDAAGVLPQLLTEYGIIGLAFCIALLRLIRGRRGPLTRAGLMLLFLTWLQSFPPAYPPFWLLLALLAHPEVLSGAASEAPAPSTLVRPTPEVVP